MSALASAAVEDVLSLTRRVTNDTGGLKDNYIPCSTVICAVGGSTSGKTRTMFGPSIAGLVSSATRTTMRMMKRSPALILLYCAVWRHDAIT